MGDIALPASGTGDAGKKASTVHLSNGADVQNVQVGAASEGGSFTPVAIATQATLAAVLAALGSPYQAAGALPLPAGASTEATVAAVLAKLNGTIAVSGSFSSAALPDITGTATFTGTGTITLTGLAGYSTLVIEHSATGNTATGVTAAPQGSFDGGATWDALPVTANNSNASTQGVSIGSAPNVFVVQIAGYQQVRYVVTAFGTGSYVVNLRASVGSWNTRSVTATITGTPGINNAQVNGVTPLMGAGPTGTGAQRVTVSNAATGTTSQVASSASSVTILAANTLRAGATIWNDSSAILYVKFGTTASITDCTKKLIADEFFVVPAGYNGKIDGIWAAANGFARVTEIT